MMDCKAALVEAEGDPEKALDILRRKGAAAAAGKAGRETAEGRIGCYVDGGSARGALVELRCETAPVAGNQEFMSLANGLAREVAMSEGPTDPARLLEQRLVEDAGRTVCEQIREAVNKLRENITLARAARMRGALASYVHHNGQVGVLTEFAASGVDPQLASDICMQIAAMDPIAVSREGVEAAVVARELEVAREQAAATGKGAPIVEKIAQGKLNKWYSQYVLLEQPFVRDDGKTVQQVLKAAGVAVKGFVRMQVGQIAR
jgi:elongation factor Ts